MLVFEIKGNELKRRLLSGEVQRKEELVVFQEEMSWRFTSLNGCMYAKVIFSLNITCIDA